MLVENNVLKLSNSSVSLIIEDSVSRSVSSNPKAINDKIYVHVFQQKNSIHAPSEDYYQDTIDGSERFEDFGINVMW